MNFKVPENVRSYIVNIFSEVNDHISRKISSVPNISEEALDFSFIENLSRYSAPRIIAPNWAIRIAAHFIGNIRHRRRYEIADIGVVLVFKYNHKVVAQKLILLQSKRLYPTNNQVIELDDYDYDLGLALITHQDRLGASIFSKVQFLFDHSANYGALSAKSNQCTIIQEHFQDTNIPVHYLMYNPLVLPWSISYPIDSNEIYFPERELGARVIASENVHSILKPYTSGATLKFADICNQEGDGNTFGWSLEDFFDDVIQCKEGYIFNRDQDVGLNRLFERKSGPIYSIIEVVIEQNEK